MHTFTTALFKALFFADTSWKNRIQWVNRFSSVAQGHRLSAWLPLQQQTQQTERFRGFFYLHTSWSVLLVVLKQDFCTYLELSMRQHCGLREAVPTLHQVNHIQHSQEGQGDVHIATRARTLQVRDVMIVSCSRRCGLVVATDWYGGGAENGHTTDSAPG